MAMSSLLMMMTNSLQHDYDYDVADDKDDDYDYVMNFVGCLNNFPMMPVTLLIVETILEW